MIAANLPALTDALARLGFTIERHACSVNAAPPGCELRIQFTTDERYQPFVSRKKDELDLIRLAEAFPHLQSRYPRELQEQLNRG